MSIASCRHVPSDAHASSVQASPSSQSTGSQPAMLGGLVVVVLGTVVVEPGAGFSIVNESCTAPLASIMSARSDPPSIATRTKCGTDSAYAVNGCSGPSG